MNSTYQVRTATGALLGVFPASEMAAVKACVAANPGAQVKAVTTITDACTAHPAFEAGNCPSCGTARSI